MDLKNPTGFLCCLGDFRKVQTEPLEKVNCKLLLNRTPQNSALFKQLTFHGKMASVAIIKDVLLHLDKGFKSFDVVLNAFLIMFPWDNLAFLASQISTKLVLCFKNSGQNPLYPHPLVLVNCK